MIKLFFDEVEKEKQTKALYNKNRPWFGKKIDALKQGVASIGISLGILSEPDNAANKESAAISAPLAETETPLLTAPPPLLTESEFAAVPDIEPAPEPIQAEVKQINEIRPKEQASSPISSFPIGAGGGSDKIPPPKPMIYSPAEDNQVFTATSVTFQGRAEKNSTISNNLNSQKTTTDSSEDYGFWILTLNSLPQGTSTIEFLSTDIAGNISEGISRTIFIDSIGPSSSLTVSECNQSLSTQGCLTTDTELTLEWSSSATDFSHYLVSCQNEGSACSGFSVSSTATTTIYTVPANNTTYTFKVKAVDIYGNRGTEQSQEVEIIDRPVIINEIAWAGTSATREADEWIELYNPTNRTIDISQMKVKSQTDNRPNINLSGTIPSKGYYLVERTDDNTISDITASTTSSFGNGNGAGLVNTGEVLAIEYKGAVIDATPEISSCSGWCGGNSSSYYTMERYDPTTTGTSTTNWGTWTSFLGNGLNADGVAIKGTPGKRNSINYMITRDGSALSQNKTLATTTSPYIINNFFTVNSGATLTVDPGVVIKFVDTNAGLEVNGVVNADGIASEPIVFTSLKDDAYGGDTNQDSASTTPAVGDWRAVKVLANGSVLDNVVMRYGGYKDSPSASYWANLRVENSSVSISNSIFEYSAAYGAYLKTASSTIEGNTFRNNIASSNTDSTGLLVTDGTLIIQNNTFSSNSYGLRITSAGTSHSIAVNNNTFTGNSIEAIDVVSAFPTFSGNTVSNSGTNGILYQGVISQNYTFSSNLPYKISTGLSVSASTTLTLGAGAILKFTNSGSLTVQGNLSASGASTSQVVFTSIKDDAYGGDTNNDGTVTTPAKADWSQVHLENATATSTISYVLISYGTTGLKLTNSNASLQNVTFKINTLGIQGVGTSTVTASGIIFDGNTTDDDPSTLIP